MFNLAGLQNLLIKRAIHTTSKLKGYIVLVPEIGEDNDAANAIVNSADGLPNFNNLTVENCLANIGKQAGIVEKTVKEIEENIINNSNNKNNINIIDTIFKPLENATIELETTWGIAKTLYLGNSSKMPTKYYLNIHERAIRARSSKFYSPIIYDCILKSTNPSSSSVQKFQLNEKRLIDKYLLEGKLNGLLLQKDNKNKLSNILNDLSKERATFKNKVNASIKQFSHTITNYSLVRNFPSELLIACATDYNHPTKGPWKITLKHQSIIDEFLKYCPDRIERWNIWSANVRKSSNLNDKTLDTSTNIELIRSLRNRQAELLGYKTYADMSMQTKMIKNINNCFTLFDILKKHSKYKCELELNNLHEYAVNNGFNYKLNTYDILYWKRKYLKSEYDIDEELLREYFPLNHVINEIIKLCENIFEIKFIERNDINGWHQTVKYYDIYDNNGNKSIAGLYLDFYSHDNLTTQTSTAIPLNQQQQQQIISTSSNGWMVSVRNRSEINNNIIKPLSALIFNFNKPIYGKSYLLTQQDLKLLFKNFGIALQHLLTKSKYSDISGLSNIEWDATEICGYVFMNLLENSNISKQLSCHYNTEEQLNDNYTNFIKNINQYLYSYELCKQLYLSDLDLKLHSKNDFWLDIVKNSWKIYMPKQIELDKKDNHLCSWTDIFSGDWAAAYFSHLHSKMIADDISSSFDEDIHHHNQQQQQQNSTTITNTSSSSSSSPASGSTSSSIIMQRRFRDMFLCNDGSLTTAEIFRRYRGRDPSPLLLLKRSNIFNSHLHSED